MTQKYLWKCPHQKEVLREKVDFFTDEHGIDRVKVLESHYDTVPCGERKYEILSDKVFTPESGYDPKGIKVRCHGCNKEYYVFPGRGERLPSESEQ